MKAENYLGRLNFYVVAAVTLLALGLATLLSVNQAEAQGPTAVPLVVPTLTPVPTRVVTSAPTRTATPVAPGLARVEAKDKTTGANIRAAPSLDSEIVGKIFPGQFYGVIGRSSKWLQIQYDKSNTGLGWVFEDIVTVTGLDAALIPTVGQGAVPSPNVATGAAQATANLLTLTPGAPQTATMLQRSATGVFTLAPGVTPGATRAAILPTFTFPPPFVEATLPPRLAVAGTQSGVPPVVPILALGAVGLLGLLVGLLRRF